MDSAPVAFPDVATELARFEELRQQLHRGGAWAHYVLDGARAIWFPTDEPAPVPAGRRKVYFTVSPSSQIPPTNAKGEACPEQYRHAQNAYLAAINCLYAEWDAKDFGDDLAAALDHVESLPDRGVPRPSALTCSGGGYQGYWLLVEPFPLDSDEARARAAYAQAKWVELVHGDPGVHDLRRILRVPGTWNTKPAYGPEGRLCHFEWFELAYRFGLYELEALLPPPPPPPDPAALEAARERARRRRERDGDDATARAISRYIADRLDAESRDLAMLTKGGRSARLVVAAMRLGGIRKSDWGAELTEGEIERTLEEAATACGLVRDYSLRDVQRQIANGLRQGDALIQPNFRLLYPDLFPVAASNGGSGEPPAPPPIEGSSSEPPARMDLLKFEATDEGNAEAVFAVFGPAFRYVGAWGWLHWTGTHWSSAGAEEAAEFAVVEVLRERRLAAVKREIEAIVSCAKPNRARVRACMEMLKKHVLAEPSEFDAEPFLLNVANGVLDLRTGELSPHDTAQRFTYCLPTAYDAEADASAWVEFLAGVVGSAGSLLAYLQEAVGYSLTGSTREECLFYVHGPTRSGKGTFSETLLAMMGHEPLAAEVDFGLFTAAPNADAQNFALAPLRPCRAIFASESNRYDPLNEARVKATTGGNRVYCAFKGKDHFSYRPQFKVWLSSNHPPRGDVDDDALWRSRIKVIEFPTSHVGQEDKSLKARLTSPEALQGVLAWAVEGAMRWANRPAGLIHPEQVTTATQAARDALDTVKQWLEENTAADADAFTSNALIQANYEAWCKAHGHKPKGGSTLGRALAAKGYTAARRYMAGSTTQVRGFDGLRLIESTSDHW